MTSARPGLTKRGDLTKRGEFEVKFEKSQGILYRIRCRIDGLGETGKQIMVPKCFRVRVMEVAHDSIFGGHLGVKKTKDRIQTNFYWPRMHNDVSGFCRSCDVLYVKRPLTRELLPELLSAKCR